MNLSLVFRHLIVESKENLLKQVVYAHRVLSEEFNRKQLKNVGTGFLTNPRLWIKMIYLFVYKTF